MKNYQLLKEKAGQPKCKVKPIGIKCTDYWEKNIILKIVKKIIIPGDI
jgi:hypothetical protein